MDFYTLLRHSCLPSRLQHVPSWPILFPRGKQGLTPLSTDELTCSSSSLSQDAAAVRMLLCPFSVPIVASVHSSVLFNVHYTLPFSLPCTISTARAQPVFCTHFDSLFIHLDSFQYFDILNKYPETCISLGTCTPWRKTSEHNILYAGGNAFTSKCSCMMILYSDHANLYSSNYI